MSTLIYATEPVALHRVKAGDRVEHKGHIYRIFRFIPVAKPHKPLGCVAIAVRQDAMGNPLDESVALCYSDTNEVVRLVCAPGVAR